MSVWRWRCNASLNPRGAKEREGGVADLGPGACVWRLPRPVLVLLLVARGRRFSGACSMVEPAAGAAAERRLSNIVMSAPASAAPSRGSKLVTAKKALQQFEGPSTSTHVLLPPCMPGNGLDC